MSAGGVRLLLEPGTRIPNWVRMQDRHVEINRTRKNDRWIRLLKIRRASALFLPGGSVGVQMPGCSGLWGAFAPLKVLEIQNLRGKMLYRNHYLCTACFTLTGKGKGDWPQSKIVGRVDATFQCTECGLEWTKTI